MSSSRLLLLLMPLQQALTPYTNVQRHADYYIHIRVCPIVGTEGMFHVALLGIRMKVPLWATYVSVSLAGTSILNRAKNEGQRRNAD